MPTTKTEQATIEEKDFREEYQKLKVQVFWHYDNKCQNPVVCILDTYAKNLVQAYVPEGKHPDKHTKELAELLGAEQVYFLHADLSEPDKNAYTLLLRAQEVNAKRLPHLGKNFQIQEKSRKN